MNTLRPRACIWLVLLCVPSQAVMQDEQTLKLRAEARLVEVVVSVRDARCVSFTGYAPCSAVKGLKPSDFTLFDNGKPRAFTIFSANDFDSIDAATGAKPVAEVPHPQPDLPPNTFTNAHVSAPPQDAHSTIILLDGVNVWFPSFVWGSRGVQGLMAKLPPNERVAVYVVAKYYGLEQLQDYTTDHARIAHLLATYIPRGLAPGPGGGSLDGRGMFEDPPASGPSRPSSNSTGGPPPPDASRATAKEGSYELQRDSESVRLSLQALAERLRTLPGRKSLFWVTEGFPPRQLRYMKIAWDKTVTALNDANIEVNTVDTDGLGGPSREKGPGGILTMQQIAEETGGESFFHTNDLTTAMVAGVEDSRSTYTLAFYLTEVDGKYHSLKVTVDRPHMELNYRQGYWARSEADADLSSRGTDLSAVLLNPVDSVGVGITATIDLAGKTLTAHVRLDSDSLSVKKSATGWTGNVEEVFIEFNPAGREVGRVTVNKVFAIDADQKSMFDVHGALLSQSLPLAAGASRLSIAVRDSASGRTGSLTVPLEQVTAK